MQTRIILFLFLVIMPLIDCFAQEAFNIKSTDPIPVTFIEALEGVRFVNMYVNENYLDYITSNPNSGDVQLLTGFVEFLKTDLGFPRVAITKDQLDEYGKLAETSCDFVEVNSSAKFVSDLGAVGRITEVIASFMFCDGTLFYIQIPDYSVSGWTKHAKRMRTEWAKRMPYGIAYNTLGRKSIARLPIIATEDSIITSLERDSTHSNLEGIYQYFNGSAIHLDKVAVFHDANGLVLIHISGKGKYEKDWIEGELKGYLQKTSSFNDFILNFYLEDKSIAKGSVSFSEGGMQVFYEGKEFKFVKM